MTIIEAGDVTLSEPTMELRWIPSPNAGIDYTLQQAYTIKKINHRTGYVTDVHTEWRDVRVERAPHTSAIGTP